MNNETREQTRRVLDWRQAQAGWYVAKLGEGERFVHVKREDNPRWGWFFVASDSAFEFSRASDFISGGWRTKYEAQAEAEEWAYRILRN